LLEEPRVVDAAQELGEAAAALVGNLRVGRKALVAA